MENRANANLEERLARLEKQGRWWRAGTLLLAVILGVFLSAAFAWQNEFDRGFILPHPPEGVRARAFVLTDQSGKVQGEWTTEGGQPVVLWLAPPQTGLKPAEAK
jgi:hypothetical protein